MGPPRPGNLNLSHDNLSNAGSDELNEYQPPKKPGYLNLPSPRAGEVPPALSPLDALAYHLRPLHDEFKRKEQEGRRVSRLPPVMVAKEIKSRPDYFRSLSNESRMSDLAEAQEDTTPMAQQVTIPVHSSDTERPKSQYPIHDRASFTTQDTEDIPAVPTPFFDAMQDQLNGVNEDAHTPSAVHAQDYFGSIPRAASPEAVDAKLHVQAPSPNAPPSLSNSIDTVSSHPRTRTNDSQRSQISDKGLVPPPQSPRFPRSPRSFHSIRSVPPDSDAEDAQSMNGSQAAGPPSRKFSGSSGMSRPQSPFSPWMQPVHRSPSTTSEYSMSGSQIAPRPNASFSNFSRPMSSVSSRPSFDTRPSLDDRTSLERQYPDIPHRHASGASTSTTHSTRPAISRQGSGDDGQRQYRKTNLRDINTSSPQTSLEPDQNVDGALTPGTQSSSSYVYAKYALPRGRAVDRGSNAFRDSWIHKQFEWDRQHPNGHVSHERTHSDSPLFEQAVRGSPSSDVVARGGRELVPGTSAARSRSADPRDLEQSRSHKSSPSVKTSSTDRTIKDLPLHKKSTSADMTPDEHLEVGIAAHDRGETNKSTYHLRLAAMAGLPTGMLLYALACRHGWGMRANQEEGVKWLRKAVEISGLDTADAEERLDADKNLDVTERKKRKAQYALAIYELGISSMNGWGCAKDKPLAVRCFEIAGSWGDVDALAEAAYCYTQGVGVKKDLKKGAALYRRAADQGMSMAGNSWIYKPKYMEETPAEKRPSTAVSSETKNDEKPSGRTRSRSIWGKKKADKPPALPLPASERSS